MKKKGIWEKMMTDLVKKSRIQAGRNPDPPNLKDIMLKGPHFDPSSFIEVRPLNKGEEWE